MAKKISYATRDFAGLRQELVNLTKEYYPDLVKNTNDASIYSVLSDLNAAVADNLHYHIDRVWQETMLDFAQQRQSLFHIAKTYGIRLPGTRPSVALCDFSINVPVRGDKEDERYLGTIKAGAQVSGGGQSFETIEDIDFASPFNSKGEPNRLKIPNFDGNNRLVSYTIVKREAVVNGVTRIFRKVITELDQKPFLKLYLPEQNVLGVTAVVHKDGTSFAGNPTNSEFLDPTNKWYEVKSLIQDKVFIPDPTNASDRDNFRAGKYISVANKFITEYTPEGYFLVTFGSGNVDPMDNLDDYMSGSLKVNLGTYLNNMSLGALPKVGTTVFIKYRIGGGKDSNLGVNVVTSIDDVDFVLTGPNSSINSQVNLSLIVTNVTPAIGGADQPSIDEIRNVMEEDNKVKIKLLSYDENGNLSDTVSTTLKNNILNYLSEYRMINDYVDIESGQVIDLGLEIDLVIDKNGNQTEIITTSVEDIVDYFAIEKRKMGDPLLVGDLNRLIGQVNGVVNVVDIRVFNLTGGEYSSAEVAQSYSDPATKEILQADMTIYMKSNQIFQIRFPNKDIKIRVKTLGSTTF